MEFVVLGSPAPQGSKTAIMVKGRAVVVEGRGSSGRARHRAWRHAVAEFAAEYGAKHGPVPDGPLHVEITFVLQRPKSARKSVVWCDKMPDLDKLVRGTLDGLADGGLVAHDQRVCSLHASKRYALPGDPTGARIYVGDLGPGEPESLRRESKVSVPGFTAPDTGASEMVGWTSGDTAESRTEVALVFDDWRDVSGQSIYHTEMGVDLSTATFHAGTTFRAMLHLGEDDADDLARALAAGYRPVFWAAAK